MRRRRRRESERWGASARFFCVFCFADFRPFSFLASPPLRSHLSSNPFSFSSHQNLQPPLRNRNSYVDSSVIMGMTGGYKQDGTGFEGIEYMLCRPETEFFPDLAKVRVRFRFRFFFFVSGFFSFARARVGKRRGTRFSLLPFFPALFLFPLALFSDQCSIHPREGEREKAFSRETKARVEMENSFFRVGRENSALPTPFFNPVLNPYQTLHLNLKKSHI